MKVRWQDRDWELQIDDISLKQAIVVQSHTGLSINKFADVLNDEVGEDGKVITAAVDKPEFLICLQTVYWLMLQQNGETTPVSDADFPIGAFSAALGDAVAAAAAERIAAAQRAAAAAEAPDPTRPPEDSEPSPEPSSPSPASTDAARTPDG